MPFRSQAQRAYFHEHLPDLVARWEADTPKGALPEHVEPKSKRKGVRPVKRPKVHKPAVSRR
jgi:hypothetical protein